MVGREVAGAIVGEDRHLILRHDKLNTNTWFNMNRNVDAAGTPTAKPVVKQYQPGGRIGGPIVKDKAFFFVNYEWIDSPGTITSNQTIMSPTSEQGIFLYRNGASSVDLMQLAAAKGCTSTIDPLIAQTLAAIRASTSGGTVNATTDPLTQTFTWQQPSESTTKYPTVRLDYNLTSKHRLTGSFTHNHLVSNPDTTNGYQRRFPDFPVRGQQDSVRYTGQASMRSMLTANLINEVRFGATGNARHVFVANWVYELPFGQGKPFASNVNQWLRRLVGNWSWAGTARIQSGRMVDFGNVNLVGFTKEDLPGMFQTRLVTDPNNGYRTLVYMLPQDVIDESIKAYSVTATGYSALGAPSGRYFAPANGPNCVEVANGYGDCAAQSVIVTGPPVIRFDMSVIKEVRITGRVMARFEAMIFNVFNNVNFTPNAYTGSTSDSYQITGSVDGSRTMQLAFRVTW